MQSACLVASQTRIEAQSFLEAGVFDRKSSKVSLHAFLELSPGVNQGHREGVEVNCPTRDGALTVL